jgi:hypothetical protein
LVLKQPNTGHSGTSRYEEHIKLYVTRHNEDDCAYYALVRHNRYSNGKTEEVVKKMVCGNRDEGRNMSKKITLLEAKHNAVPRDE